MGAAASVSAEAELSTFKEMRTKFEALKEEGKTDEDIYAELKTLYNTTVGAGTAPPVANGPVTVSDVEKPAAAPDAAAAEATPAAETATPAGDTLAEPAAASEGGGGDAAATATAPAEGAAPAEAPATAE